MAVPDRVVPAGLGMGGLIASGGARPADVQVAFGDLRRSPALRTSLRPNPLAGPAWEGARPSGAIAVPRLAHVLDLAGGFDLVWLKRFTGAARTAARKAERSGVTVECDTTGRLVPAFYRLFELSLDRWAAAQHEPRALARWRGRRRDPPAKLRAIAERLGAGCRVWLASVDGRPVAGIVVIQGPNANYARGAMDKDLAGRHARTICCSDSRSRTPASGWRWCHMGETGASPSLAQFKTRFGARPQPYAEYHLERVPVAAVDHALRTSIKRAIRFRDVPVAEP